MARPGPTAWTAFVHATSGGHGARFNLARHAVKVVGDERLRPAAASPGVQGRAAPRPLRLHRRALHGGCPAAPEHPRLPLAGGPRQARRGHGGDPAHQPAARHHRQRLRPPLHRALRAQLLRRPPGHPRDQALRLRVRRRPPRGPGGPGGRQGGHRRRRPGRAVRGLLPGQAWASRSEVFEAKEQPGRHGERGHPRLPAQLRDPGRRPGPPAPSWACGSTSARPWAATSPWTACAGTSPTCSWGSGASRASAWASPGEDAPGVMDALEFLDKVQAGTPMDLGRRVLVIGGGNSGHGRGPLRPAAGAKDGEVTLVYRAHPGPDARRPRRGGGLPRGGHRPARPAGPGRGGGGRPAG